MRLLVVALAALATVARAQCYVEGDEWYPRPIQRKNSGLPTGSDGIKVAISAVKTDKEAPVASKLVFPENIKVRLDEAITLTARCDKPAQAFSQGFPLGRCTDDCGYHTGEGVSITCSERTKDATWTMVFCQSGGGEPRNFTGQGTTCVRVDDGSWNPQYFSVDCSAPPGGYGRTGNTRETPVTVEVVDEVSGVSAVFLELSTPSDKTVSAFCSNRASPNLYSCGLSISQASEAGVYTFRRLHVQDRAGNERSYTAQNPPLESTVHPIEVIIDDPDTTAPQASAASLTAPDTVTLNYNEESEWNPWTHDDIVLRFNVTDDKTGFTGASFTFRSPAVFGSTYNVIASVDRITSGSRKAGFVEYKLNAHFTYPGVWTLAQMTLRDAAHNFRTYTDMNALGFSRTTFTLRTPKAPEYPAARDIKPGSIAIWPATLDLSASGSGMQKVYLNVTLTEFNPDSHPTVVCNLKSVASPVSFISIRGYTAFSPRTSDGGTLLTGSAELDSYGLHTGEYRLVGCYVSEYKDHKNILSRTTWHVYGELTPDQQDELDPKPDGTSSAAGRSVSLALLVALLVAASAQLLA